MSQPLFTTEFLKNRLDSYYPFRRLHNFAASPVSVEPIFLLCYLITFFQPSRSSFVLHALEQIVVVQVNRPLDDLIVPCRLRVARTFDHSIKHMVCIQFSLEHIVNQYDHFRTSNVGVRANGKNESMGMRMPYEVFSVELHHHLQNTMSSHTVLLSDRHRFDPSSGNVQYRIRYLHRCQTDTTSTQSSPSHLHYPLLMSAKSKQ